MSSSSKKTDYEVLIVGGGPAGLSAALMLGRCRRTVLIVDAGKPRNRSSPHMHGFLSRDGIPPLEFLQISRRQLEAYPNVIFQEGVVKSLTKSDSHFHAQMENGASFSAQLLLLAMGIVDDLPDLPGIDQFYGRSIHHCPYCDGWEHQDKRIAVYGTGKAGPELAGEMRGWSSDVVYCSHGEKLDASSQELLSRLKIPVETGVIIKLSGDNGMLDAIHFTNGRKMECTALFFAGRQRQHASLAQDLGCDLHETDFVECGEGVCTSVGGVYAAGNTASGLQLAIIAAAEGTKAAWAINQAFLEQERLVD